MKGLELASPKVRGLSHRVAYALIASYIIILSLIPLLSGLLTLGEWIAFDTGAYYYRNERLEVRVTGLPEALGKPRIYIYIPNSSYRPVLLIDLDDRESSVNGLSFFYDSKEVRITSFNETLVLTYVFDSFNVSKYIVALNDSVKIIVESTRNSYFQLVFQGRNYTVVNGIRLTQSHEKNLVLENVTKLDLEFNNRFVGRGGVSLTFSQPLNVTIVESTEDIVRIVISSWGDRVEVEVKGYIESPKVSYVTSTISAVLNHRFVQILLPFMAVAALAVGWIIWRKL